MNQGMPQGAPSPWLGMQTQPTPEQMQQMQMQQMMQQQQMQQPPMMVAQNGMPQQPTNTQTMAQSVRNAMGLNPSPNPAASPGPAYPGFAGSVTDRINKIKGKK